MLCVLFGTKILAFGLSTGNAGYRW